MKMLFCSDIRLGAACTENMEVKYARKWHEARTEQFRELYDKALREHASYVLLFGDLFGQERVSEALIDALFEAAGSEKSIKTLAIVDQKEWERISYRKDMPGGLRLLCTEKADSVRDKEIAVRTASGGTEIRLGKHEPFKIQKTPLDTWHVVGLKKGKYLLSFEPTGFEDAENSKFGYSYVEWTENSIKAYEEIREQRFQYETAVLKIEPHDTNKEILQKATVIARDLRPETVLRVELRGRTAFALPIPVSQIREKLENRVFFAKIFDNTIMDVNEAEFENDISLRSEFVRLALRDETLSEAERNRLIRYGWNALSGKEVNAE